VERFFIWDLPILPVFVLSLFPRYDVILKTILQFKKINDVRGITVYLNHPDVGGPVTTFLLLLLAANLVWGLLYIPMVAFSKEKAGPHDRFTETRVFTGRPM
jgi:hypothetical protein